MNDRAALAALLRTRSVTFGDFVLASGRRSSYYIDARRTTLSAEGLALIGRVGLAAIRTAGWAADAVGGLTLGADPVACAIARASVDAPPPIEAFTVRKESKDHGARQRIEGPFASGMRVVIVEDVITTGGSALQALDAVRQRGGAILGVLAVVDRQEGGREAIEARGYAVVAMTTITDLGLPPP